MIPVYNYEFRIIKENNKDIIKFNYDNNTVSVQFQKVSSIFNLDKKSYIFLTNSYVVGFYENDVKDTLTNNYGSLYKKMNTIIDIIKKYAELQNSKVLLFEPLEQKREKLYNRYLHNLNLKYWNINSKLFIFNHKKDRIFSDNIIIVDLD
jgi:hypothetical protein